MGRPRKYIQVNGRTIDGVSSHRATGRYYIFDDRGKQRYFRDWRTASAAYQSDLARRLQPVDLAKLQAQASVRLADAQERLRETDQGSRADDLMFENVAEHILREGTSAWLQFLSKMNITADELGVPKYEVIEVGQPVAVSEAIEPASAENPCLSKLGEKWLQGKMTEKGMKYVPPEIRAGLNRSPLTQHMQDTLVQWCRFVNCVGDVRIADLKPEHFRLFHAWADREAAKRRTTRWHGQLMSGVKTVFNYCQRHYVDWKWPPLVAERIRAYTPRRYASSDDNAQPMPPEIFRRLLGQCDEWAAVDPGQIEGTTQEGRGKRLQAIRQQRNGQQTRVALMLAINGGLNATDIERLDWGCLQLDAPIPHFSLGREKIRHSVGKAVERRTPLIPQVAEALKAWREIDPADDGIVFHTAIGTPLKSTILSRTVGRLLDDAGLDHEFTFKSLRNCGPTLAANEGLPEEMIERFLGHKKSKVSNRYKGIKPVEYLLSVVDLIEKKYFC